MWLQLFGAIVAVKVTRASKSGIFSGIEWPNLSVLSRLIRLGLPMGGTIFIEVAFFSGVTLFIGRLGVEAIAAHQIAMSVGSIGFMIPLALSLATTIRVGASVGAANFRVASRTVIVSIGISLLVGICIALILFVGRDYIVALYSDDVGVLELASLLLLMCAFFQLFDASQVTAIGSLRGFKDAMVPMCLVTLSYWLIGMPLGASLAYGIGPFEGVGVVGFWWGLVVGLACASTMLLVRVRWIAKNASRKQFQET
ncbi:MAG: MATE family efflux transporter [Gammaproteobacteria bacterium]|nr:MATE family efflux transporter [Gammaproteobacteria bacterium]